jgi:hypothetical protein
VLSGRKQIMHVASFEGPAQDVDFPNLVRASSS